MESKRYELRVWPPNDNVRNTKRYKIIKKSPVALSTKILTSCALLAFLVYITFIRSYLLNMSLVELAKYQFSGPKKILFNISVAIVVNSILCYVFQGDFEERIMVIKNIGIELSSTCPTRIFFLKDSTVEEFIPMTDIVDIIISEAFKGFEVIFYMVVIRVSKPELTIVFEKLLPRRPQLETVLSGCREVLFSGRDDNKLQVPGWKRVEKESVEKR